LCVPLLARENPFFPAPNTQAPSYTSNEVQKPSPFTTTQTQLPSSARILESVTFTYINLDGSVGEQTVHLHKSIDWHKPFFISQEKVKHYKQTNKQVITQHKQPHLIATLPFISFLVEENTLYVKTKDPIIRNFKLIKPDRIVLDLRRDVNFRSYKYTTKTPFSIIRLGNHSGYYRVVIELDGHYMYKLQKIEDGYKVILQ
jgi:hypothetical protein